MPSDKEVVLEKWPDAVATFGTVNPLPSVLIWQDSKNGPVIGRGVTGGTDWVEAEDNAWSDAARRIREEDHGK